MARSGGGIIGASATMFSGTAVSRGLGFLRTALLTAALATFGGAADGFAVANSLPNVVSMLLATGVLNAVIVPQLVRAARLPDGGQDYTNRLLTVTGVALAVVTVLLTLGATLLVNLYASNLDEAWLPVAYAFAYWCLPQVFFYGLYTLLGQVLNARKVFGPYMWAPALNNVVAIIGLGVYLVVFGRMPPELLAAGEFGADRILLLGGTATLGVVLQALVLIIPLRRSGFRYRPAWGFEGLGTASRVAMWSFAQLVVGQIAFIAVSNVATAAGSYTDADSGYIVAGKAIYDVAFLVIMLPQSLIVVSLVTAMFTRMSEKASASDVAGVRSDLSLALRTVAVFTMPAAAIFLVLGNVIARAVTFAAQPIDSDILVGVVIASMTIGLPFLAFWTVVQRVHLSYQDARTVFFLQIPMAAVQVAIVLSGPLFLPPDLWVAWAGFGISVSYAIGAVLGYLRLRPRVGDLDGKLVWSTTSDSLWPRFRR